MASILPQMKDEEQSDGPRKSALPDASVLQDKMPEWFRSPWTLPALTLVLGVAFMLFSYYPLWHTDLWGHLAYGRLIWSRGSIPSTEPLLPLAEGMRFIDTAWLSQILAFGAFKYFGVSSLQFLYAASITTCLALLTFRLYQRTGKFLWPLVGCAVFQIINYQQLLIIRPQLAGLIGFITLFVMLTSSRWHRSYWVGVPVLFALWANLHGSFLMGIAMLGAFFVGRAVDLVRKTRSGKSLVHDPELRRYFLLTQLAAAAVLINPYGLGLYAEVIAISSNANLQELVEWEPLTLRAAQGPPALMAVMLLVFLYRFSQRRISFTEPLLVFGLGIAMLWSSRMIIWWAPVMAYYLVLHGENVWRQFRAKKPRLVPREHSSKWTIITLGLIWICFAYTPFGLRLLHGTEREIYDSVSSYTPVGAVGYLRENPPRGLVFNTYEFGDFLLFTGPRNIQVFAASHAHLLPPEIWQHYLEISNAVGPWESDLDLYGINTVVVDPVYRDRLIEKLKDQPETWELKYEDARAAVFTRRNPIE